MSKLGVALVLSTLFACTQQEAKTAAQAAVLVSADICKALQNQPVPDAVQIACQGVGLIQIPASQWRAMQAAAKAADAGAP